MEMFQYDFIQRAFLAGIAMSFITPILGLFLILRKQSLLSDTLSHISLAGVALGLILQVSPTLTTLGVVVLASLGIEYLRTIYQNFSEVSVAIMMSSGMALALVLLGLNSASGVFKVDQFLFGSIILIQEQEVRLLIMLALVMVVLYVIFHRPLYVVSFDEATAQTSGLPVKLISTTFSVLTGVTISIMMPIVGALLVSALIIIPSATAIKLAKSFMQAIIIGMVINLVGILGGLYASFNFDTPPGASITLAFVFIFILVTLGQTIQTWIRKAHQK